MEDQMIIDEIIRMILDSREDIQTQVVFSDDLYKKALAVCENAAFLELLQGLPQAVKSSIRSRNSFYVPPKSLQDPHFLLIHNRQREDGYSHYSSVAQEAVHARNFTIFCEKQCDGDICQLNSNPYSKAFRLWDEFDARRTSHRLYLSLVLQQLAGYSVADVSNLLVQQELPYRLQELEEMRKEPASLELYLQLVSLFGMFQVWEDGYQIPVSEKLDPWCLAFYRSLKQYGSLEQVQFPSLMETLQSLQK